MSLVVLGLDHRSTPLAERERLAYTREELEGALPRLRASAHLQECFLVSTCNRTELYGSALDLAGAPERMRAALARDRGLDPGPIARMTRFLHEDAAVAHLFRVASGLESMVLGESQVLGQVRSALASARAAGTLGVELDGLGRYAVACGRRARSETAIGRSPMSFAHAALALARQEGIEVERAEVLVLGSGQVATSVVSWFGRAGASITVASRTLERAQALAAKHDAIAIPLAGIGPALDSARIVIAALETTAQLLGPEQLGARSGDRLVIDLGVPRSVTPQTGDLPGIRLYDLDGLEQILASGQRARAAEARRVEAIVAEEAGRYLAWRRARHVAPTVAQLQALAETIRTGESARFERELAGLDPEQRQAVESLTRSIVNKLLNRPLLRLKESVQADHGLAYIEVLRSLFELPAAQDLDEGARDDQAAL